MKRPIIALVASAALSLGAVSILVPTLVRAADQPADNRKERMDKNQWTNADRARDALDHLRKARAELETIAKTNKNSDVSAALSDVRSAVRHVNKAIPQFDKKH